MSSQGLNTFKFLWLHFTAEQVWDLITLWLTIERTRGMKTHYNGYDSAKYEEVPNYHENKGNYPRDYKSTLSQPTGLIWKWNHKLWDSQKKFKILTIGVSLDRLVNINSSWMQPHWNSRYYNRKAPAKKMNHRKIVFRIGIYHSWEGRWFHADNFQVMFNTIGFF